MKGIEVGRAHGIKHIYGALGGIKKIPAAAYEGCVLVPFHLAALIPKRAIREFATDKPFVVHVNILGEKGLSFYGKHRRLFPLKNIYELTHKSYQINDRESSI
jgi:hypothetical protein